MKQRFLVEVSTHLEELIPGGGLESVIRDYYDDCSVKVTGLLEGDAIIPLRKAPFEKGERNDGMHQLAQALFDSTLSVGSLMAVVTFENSRRCNPPLCEKEIDSILEGFIKARFRGNEKDREYIRELDEELRRESGLTYEGTLKTIEELEAKEPSL